jgi:hypothetical protein
MTEVTLRAGVIDSFRYVVNLFLPLFPPCVTNECYPAAATEIALTGPTAGLLFKI